jgi:hypothetical protein
LNVFVFQLGGFAIPLNLWTFELKLRAVENDPIAAALASTDHLAFFRDEWAATDGADGIGRFLRRRIL